MKYMGSKNRIAKFILPIMIAEAEKQGLDTWVEPFVGGANIIDKVPSSFKRIGYDLNPHVIEAMLTIRDNPQSLPDSLSEDEYRSIKGTAPHPINSFLRFVCSFGSRFDEGYARTYLPDGSLKSHAAMGKRSAIKQSKLIQGVQFHNMSYQDVELPSQSLIYCDPPYKGTKWYRANLVPKFDHDKFFDWCRQKKAEGHVVFVSEYQAPDDFKCLWEKELTNSMNQTKTYKPIEKLFMV
jgi:DNA adenine methylase